MQDRRLPRDLFNKHKDRFFAYYLDPSATYQSIAKQCGVSTVAIWTSVRKFTRLLRNQYLTEVKLAFGYEEAIAADFYFSPHHLPRGKEFLTQALKLRELLDVQSCKEPN